MAAKLIVLVALVAAASAAPLVPISNVAYAEAEAPAHYEFQYSVHDEVTGDIKQQHEARAGDDVHGSYSLVQPDGVHRIVEYTSSKEQGFNAVVRYEGNPIASAPHKIAYAAPVAKIAYAAPVANIAYAAPVHKVAYTSPVSYAAPVAKLAYSSPISYASPLTQVSYSSPAISYHH